MKYILLLSLLLQGCIGVSFISSHEGVKLNNPENTYTRPPHYQSLSFGYFSADDSDPGLPIALEGGRLLLSSNCLNERMVSIFPSFIIPFPPLIPLFGNGEGSLTDSVVITLDGEMANKYIIQSINSSDTELMPEKIEKNSYFFGVTCRELSGYDDLILSDQSKEITINIKFKKTYNFGWFWLGS